MPGARWGSAMRALLLLPLAGLLLAGCSSDHGDETPPQRDGAYVIVATAANKFDPAHAAVPVGSVVEWESKGVHDVVSTDTPKAFDSRASPGDTLGNGDTFRHTFTEAGEYE